MNESNIMKAPAFFPIQSLTFDPDLQIRTTINKETIALYAEQMATEEEMKKFPAVEIYDDGANYWLADGHHRRAAAEKAGHDQVWAIVKSGTRADALWGAILGNGKQGVALTRADKQRAIKLVIIQQPKRSNRSIADAVGCGKSTVDRIRDQVSQMGHLNTEEKSEARTIGKDGKSYPAKQTTKTKGSAPSTATPESTAASKPQEVAVTGPKRMPETVDRQNGVSFRPGSLPTKKFAGATELKPIPQDRPDILAANLIAFFPEGFAANAIREIFRMLHGRYGTEVTKPLALEFYQEYGRRKK